MVEVGSIGVPQIVKSVSRDPGLFGDSGEHHLDCPHREGIAQRKLFKFEEKRDLIKAGVAVPGASSDVDVWKLWKDYLPIAPELDSILHELMPEDPDPEAHVFLNAAGGPWRNNLLKRFKSCVKAAGINPAGLDIHSLRQTYGTLLAADPTNDVRTVQSLMRHRTVAMTMNLYVKPRAMRQRSAMRSLDVTRRGTTKAPGAEAERNRGQG